MIKRDFNKPTRQYFAKNKFVLIGIAVFVLLGVLIAAVFGFNGNFEFKNSYQVEVSIGCAPVSKTADKIGGIINQYGGRYEDYQITSTGENTGLVIRYYNSLSVQDQKEVNAKIEELSNEDYTITVVLRAGDTTGHNKASASITAKDYYFTAAAIGVILTIATIFAYARYNGASAITILLSCLLATLGMLCITALLRLTIGQSYFAILVMLNILVIYGCLNIFENIRSTSWLQSNNYEKALEEGTSKIRSRLCVITIAVFVIGLLFAIISPTSIKYISLSILFMAVLFLAVMLYVVPFIWSVLITHNKRKKESGIKVK